MYYAHYDEQGRYTGFYLPEIHGVKRPAYNTELIEETVIDENGEATTVAHQPGTVEVGEELDISHFPTPNILLTDEQHQEAQTGHYRVVNGQHTYAPPVIPPPTLEELQTAKWEEVKGIRDNQEQAGCPYMGSVLDTDPVSVQRISIAALTAQAAIAAGQPFAIDWTMKDNTVITMTAQEVCGMPVALAMYSNQLHQTARGLREQIEAAQTPEEVAAITWPE